MNPNNTRTASPLFWLVLFVSVITNITLGVGIFLTSEQNQTLTPLALITKDPKPLEEYRFDSLANRASKPSPIELKGVITRDDNYTAYLFLTKIQDRTLSGQINLPSNYQDHQRPVIIMLRGFVDPDLYVTGDGTRSAAAVFASNGFVTLAPDFFGYGESDDEDNDSFAARVKRPVTVLDLISAVKQLDYVDPTNIFFWAHSNGGQIAISVLEITKDPIPTSLWAPVSKPFPYSVLYYTDEFDDQGKTLRRALAKFEASYNSDHFSITNYLDQITAPIQIHQGGQDDAVPIQWSNDFVKKLEDLEDDSGKQKLEITYYQYPSSDHNLSPDWNTVVARDLAFFTAHTNPATPSGSLE